MDQSPRQSGQMHAVAISHLAVVACLLALALALVSHSRAVSGQVVPELQITSKYYIVLDAETGEVYAQRGAHERAAMASLTKIFTAIEAIERGSPDMSVTTHPTDVYDDRSSRMGFGAGETFTLHDLLYGMMLPSGNDAAHAIARSLGEQPGDSDDAAVARFMAWMNERVQNMGLKDTHLVNPHGWGVLNHYSSVYDLAAFTRYALQYPTFVDLISTPVYTTANGYRVTNTNRMLNFYPNLVGGKTGYDEDAGYCLIEVATRDGTTMISVTLDGVAPDDWYDDNRVLLDYAFEQKAQREAAGIAFTGDIVTFRDPDAAVVARMASAAGSLPAPPVLPVANAADGSAEHAGTGEDADSRSAAQSSGVHSSARNALPAIAVAIVLILARTLLGLAGRTLPRSAAAHLRHPNAPPH